MERQRVAILGASDNPERYSHKAFVMLREHGHTVIPVHPAGKIIEGIQSVRSLGEITEPVDTLTMYVSPGISEKLEDAILGLKPARIIFNPGTENPELQQKCAAQGIEALNACTLVMLRTGQF
ncbi:MAG: CoA-binding protein [Kiritimatiellia bacterium]